MRTIAKPGSLPLGIMLSTCFPAKTASSLPLPDCQLLIEPPNSEGLRTPLQRTDRLPSNVLPLPS